MFISVVVLVRLVLTLLSLALGALAFSALSRRRLAPEVPVFVLLVLSLAVYCFGYAGEVAQTTRAGAMFWLHVEYFGIPWFPALWLLMARNLNGLRSRCGLLFAVPIAAFAGEQTNSLHGLFDRSIVFIHRGPFWVLAYDRGFICWVYIAYLDFACLYGAWIYATRSSAHGRTKTQAWVLVASSLVPMVGHFIYMLGWAPWGLDVVPMLFSVTAFLMYLSVFKLGSIDLIPMAHSLVFGNMRDAVLVANLQHRLVDFNAAARKLLPSLADAKPGDDPAKVFDEMPVLADILTGASENRRLTFDSAGETKYFDICVFPLYRGKLKAGSAAILAEVTAHVQLLDELKEKAETDALTGLANRRSFLAAVEREFARADRHREPFSVAVVDLDNFKTINDQAGHHGGDTALLALVERILRCLRAADLMSRYGGDEFMVLLPYADEDGALEVAERMRAAVADSPVEVENQVLRVTISVGLATRSPDDLSDWEELLRRADKALYDAKRQGRNRVAVWQAPPLSCALPSESSSISRHNGT